MITEEMIKEQPIMAFFVYDHLPKNLQMYSAPFCDLAEDMYHCLDRSAEKSMCLRKLLEAKDCAVRAIV